LSHDESRKYWKQSYSTDDLSNVQDLLDDFGIKNEIQPEIDNHYRVTVVVIDKACELYDIIWDHDKN